MKPGLQFRLHQQLTLTPQLQQAIRLLQLSQLELEAELRQIAESNPLLEFAEEAEDDEDADGTDATTSTPARETVAAAPAAAEERRHRRGTANGPTAAAPANQPIDFSSSSVGSSGSGSRGDDDFEPQNAAPETLQQHLLWQLNLAPFDAAPAPDRHGADRRAQRGRLPDRRPGGDAGRAAGGLQRQRRGNRSGSPPAAGFRPDRRRQPRPARLPARAAGAVRRRHAASRPGAAHRRQRTGTAGPQRHRPSWRGACAPTRTT